MSTGLDSDTDLQLPTEFQVMEARLSDAGISKLRQVERDSPPFTREVRRKILQSLLNADEELARIKSALGNA